MQTKIVKIHYPSYSADKVGSKASQIRDEALNLFENNQVSFSFSSNKESGYIMVYPTPPILSIRISNHETDGTEPVDKLVIEKGNNVTINGEVESGDMVADAVVADILRKIKQQGFDIKNIIKQYGV